MIMIRRALGIAVAAGLLPLASHPAHAQNATITAPPRVAVGAPIELTWTGPGAAQEFISVDEAGAPQSRYGAYVYASRAQPGNLTAPDVPGSYVLRYHTSAPGYPVIASHALEVVDAEAKFEPIGTVEAGANVTIAWQGPDTNATSSASTGPAPLTASTVRTHTRARPRS
jgi:Ca-activated chloride channel family protein